jgi:hypothetical protein
LSTCHGQDVHILTTPGETGEVGFILLMLRNVISLIITSKLNCRPTDVQYFKRQSRKVEGSIHFQARADSIPDYSSVAMPRAF